MVLQKSKAILSGYVYPNVKSSGMPEIVFSRTVFIVRGVLSMGNVIIASFAFNGV